MEPDGADAAVIGVAREIVAAGPGRLRRRQQAGRAGDELPGHKPCPVAHGDAHEPRTLGLRDALHLRDPNEKPLPLGPVLDRLDEARNGRDGDAAEQPAPRRSGCG